jgi:hypothetical protein
MQTLRANYSGMRNQDPHRSSEPYPRRDDSCELAGAMGAHPFRFGIRRQRPRYREHGTPDREITNDIFALTPNNLDREDSNDFNDDKLQRRIASGKFSTRIGSKPWTAERSLPSTGLFGFLKHRSSRLSTGMTPTYNTPGSPGRPIQLARRSFGKGDVRWLRNTFSAVTVANATRLPTRNPTARSHSSRPSAIGILGRLSM